MIAIVYHLLRDPTLQFHDLGENYFDRRNAEQTKLNLIKQLSKLGWEVSVKPKAA